MKIKDRIEGDKINLRFITKGDALSIYQYAADEAISRYTHIPHPYNLDDAYDFVKLTQSDRKRKAAYHYGLENRETGQIIGMIGLIALFPMHRKAELGYWLAKPFWGRGIITEAIEKIVEFAFVTLKLHRVYAHVFPDNKASIRVLEKCGFTREGLIREGFVQRGKYVSVYMYSILEDEWAKRDLT
ncbi:MAG: GNAT family N-acetyltransferase [Candidatus Zixiibacteriota bacterium]|nr:MAG: GNAT family N-acetyltransferase [candidate division Zixibacteria bacterium]